jgi:hypothetical protein
MIYRLVTFGEDVALTLTEAESDSHKFAMRKLKAWADANGYQLARSPDDTEANCVAQTIHFE